MRGLVSLRERRSLSRGSAMLRLLEVSRHRHERHDVGTDGKAEAGIRGV